MNFKQFFFAAALIIFPSFLESFFAVVVVVVVVYWIFMCVCILREKNSSLYFDRKVKQGGRKASEKKDC